MKHNPLELPLTSWTANSIPMRSLVKALSTHNIFGHNSAIKRYFSTNIFFHRVNWKYLFLSMNTRVCIENHNILKCHYNILRKKLSFYRKIFLLQYCASKCLVWIRPNRGWGQLDCFYVLSHEMAPLLVNISAVIFYKLWYFLIVNAEFLW